MRIRPTILAAAFAVAAFTTAVSLSPARAGLGWLDQRNYMRCIDYAAADANDAPAGAGRDAIYAAARKACYQKFFLDRLGISG